MKAHDDTGVACGLKQQRVRENPDVQRRMEGTWGHVQSSMASRLSRVCRSAQDDLCGTFTTVIGAIFAAGCKGQWFVQCEIP